MKQVVTPSRTDVTRFLHAQNRGWPQILRELTTGRKQNHWMWFVFPQLRALSKSETAHYFGISNRAEAEAYLRNTELRTRLAAASLAVLRHDRNMFGDIDRRKLQSCMTLFREVAADPTLPDKVLAKFYGGELCQKTLDVLAGKVPTRPSGFSWPKGSAQGRVEWGGSTWEQRVRAAQARSLRARQDAQKRAAAVTMGPRQIEAFLLAQGVQGDAVAAIVDRWIDDQNAAMECGWRGHAAESR